MDWAAGKREDGVGLSQFNISRRDVESLGEQTYRFATVMQCLNEDRKDTLIIMKIISMMSPMSHFTGTGLRNGTTYEADNIPCIDRLVRDDERHK